MNLLRKFKQSTILTAEDNIVIWNEGSKRVLKVPEAPQDEKTKKGDIEGLRKIVCACVSRNHDFFAVCLQNKQLVVYDTEFNVVKNVLTNRGVSSVKFGVSTDLLIADKTGDVFVYEFKTDSQPRVILGHLSMLLDVTLSEDGKFVITCDRDEKIRVSRYPNAYNIESYCLGHEEFVVKVAVVDDVLVSASGDGTIRFWNFLNGQQLHKIDTNEQSSQGIVEELCKKLEDVQVSAVPVTDLQVFKNDSFITVAATVYGSNEVQLYKANFSGEKIDVTFVGSAKTSSTVLAFHLSENLLVLSRNEFLCYIIKDNECTKTELKNFVSFHENCRTFLYQEDNFNISTYYKRKYDNVQDYLQRKKIRLENAQ